MLIDALLKILPPPADPLETGDEPSWLRVNAAIGVRPPEDYVSFVTLYGTGLIDDFLLVFNPFSQNINLNFLSCLGPNLSALRELKQAHPDYYPVNLFFEPGGVLPWGRSIDGDLYCWRTTGLTGAWTTTVIPRHSNIEHFPVAMTQFLVGVLGGTIQTSAYPELETGHHHEFVPLGLA